MAGKCEIKAKTILATANHRGRINAQWFSATGACMQLYNVLKKIFFPHIACQLLWKRFVLKYLQSASAGVWFYFIQDDFIIINLYTSHCYVTSSRKRRPSSIALAHYDFGELLASLPELRCWYHISTFAFLLDKCLSAYYQYRPPSPGRPSAECPTLRLHWHGYFRTRLSKEKWYLANLPFVFFGIEFIKLL